MPYKVSVINPAKTALIIVDMENDFVAEGAPLRATMAPQSSRLSNGRWSMPAAPGCG